MLGQLSIDISMNKTGDWWQSVLAGLTSLQKLIGGPPGGWFTEWKHAPPESYNMLFLFSVYSIIDWTR